MRLPRNDERILILGRTGSGKTLAAVWLLSHHDFLEERWVVLNTKRDELIDSLGMGIHLDIKEKLPKEKGLYIYHPLPVVDNDLIEQRLNEVWLQGNTGVYVDELAVIDPNSRAMIAILTQGRSKKIPIILLSQRATRVTRFAISESSYIQMYSLSDDRDIEEVSCFVKGMSKNQMIALVHSLKPYHSYYYDVSKGKGAVLSPVPPAKELQKRFIVPPPVPIIEHKKVPYKINMI